MFMDAISPIANRVKRQLEESGQIGKVKTKTIYNDSKNPGVDLFGDGNRYVHASNEVIDLQIATVKIYYPSLGVLELPTDEYIYVNENVPALMDNEGGFYAFTIPDVIEGIEAGTYIRACESDGSGVYSLTTETIHPIDPKYLPSGGGGGSAPVVVDLKQFNDKNFNGMSINDELLVMVSQGLQANGALQTKTAAFDDSALFNTLSTDSQVVVTMDIGGDTILRFNPTASCLGGGKASLYSFGALMMQGYTVYELKVLFFFVDDTGTEMEIHLQAKPVA